MMPGAVKSFTAGTHRSISPEQTLARVQPWLKAMGITRIANITGLDVLGVPVVMVCRPNSRSLSVAQGKGATLAAARASGLMESVEFWHAERISKPLVLGSVLDLKFTQRLVDVARMPRLSVSTFDDHQRHAARYVSSCEFRAPMVRPGCRAGRKNRRIGFSMPSSSGLRRAVRAAPWSSWLKIFIGQTHPPSNCWRIFRAPSALRRCCWCWCNDRMDPARIGCGGTTLRR